MNYTSYKISISKAKHIFPPFFRHKISNKFLGQVINLRVQQKKKFNLIILKGCYGKNFVV